MKASPQPPSPARCHSSRLRSSASDPCSPSTLNVQGVAVSLNAVRGLILQALAAPQARLVRVEGKKRRVTVEVPMAMCDDIVAGLQLVARLGAQGEDERCR